MKKNKSPKEISIDLERADSYYRGEGMVVLNRNLHFIQDKKFLKIHNKLSDEEDEKKRIWKLHIFCCFFKHGLQLEGDLIECGVYRGFSSAVACNYFGFNNYKNKKLFLFDTWDGIPDDQLDAVRKKYPVINEKYKLKKNLLIVNKRFKNFNNVIKVKGKIPDIFKTINLPKKISFLHLDMNTHKGEISALDYIFPKLVRGAICLLDDFGITMAREQMINEKKWFLNKNYHICELPTGQGFVIKY